MSLLVLCQAARCQDVLYAGTALQVGQVQHVHLDVGCVAWQRGQGRQDLLHKVITMVTNSSWSGQVKKPGHTKLLNMTPLILQKLQVYLEIHILQSLT